MQIAAQTASNQTMLNAVDARTRLAGSNKMEILLFSLGSRETFGINVFKVREIVQTPPITRSPHVPPGVEGVISLRGSVIPVIGLVSFLEDTATVCSDSVMIITEFSRHTQGFLVHEVDRIVRVDWDLIHAPDAMLAGSDNAITAITELPDGKLVSILDVEQILARVLGDAVVPALTAVTTVTAAHKPTVFFADDSAVARKEITQVLDALGVNYLQAATGRDAWEQLQAIATRCCSAGEPITDSVAVIMTDAEMPEMDGYVLTRNVKSDKRFAGIPVVMHSSLSSQANHAMGKSVGVDAYVGKFNPSALADTLRPLLGG